jgi:hypothetical protein
MAIKSQGALVRVATAAGSPKTITAITAALPAVVTSTAHALTNGTIVVLSGIVGMTQLNGRAFVIANVAANTFELKGIDSTSYGAYVSGGIATPQTMSPIGEVTSVSGFDGQADEIDTTHLQSTAKEYLIGLQDFGNVSLDLNLVPSDVGQTKLRSLKAAAAIGYFSIALSSTETAAFSALVKSLPFTNSTNDKVGGSCSLRVTGEPSYFA